jgi:hypothetical protein
MVFAIFLERETQDKCNDQSQCEVPMFLFLASWLYAVPNGWELVSTRDNIESARKTIPNSALFAFRGETVTDVSISKLSSLLLDDPKGPDWVDLMNISAELERTDPNTKIIRQGYNLPWPLQDRDYVMKQVADYDEKNKVFTLEFESTTHPSMPVQKCCIRAQTYRTYWKLRALPNGNTKAEVEVYTDPKGSLPAWLINLIQEDWPYNTLTSLLKRVRKGDIRPAKQARGWN